MRYLFTMHMPSGNSNNLVHQIIADHPAEGPAALCDILSDDPFVVVRQWYYETDHSTGERIWIDRGEVVLNTAHIGKVAVHYTPQEREGGDTPRQVQVVTMKNRGARRG